MHSQTAAHTMLMITLITDFLLTFKQLGWYFIALQWKNTASSSLRIQQ